MEDRAGIDSVTGKEYRHATFAGGCFWCMVPPFEGRIGIVKVVSGYTGGKTENPTYEKVCAGGTGHLEAVDILFDPALISYRQLLDTFWHSIDPTDTGGQFYDRGRQYLTAIFYHDDEQRRQAEESLSELEQSGRFNKPVVTRILKAGDFYDAEEYHQDYYNKNAEHYAAYSKNSGREDFLKNAWSNDF